MLVTSVSTTKSRRPHSFQLDDKVMLVYHPVNRAVDKFADKLAPHFVGPFLIG